MKIWAMLLILVFTACNNNQPSGYRQNGNLPPVVQVNQMQAMLAPEDFGLNLIGGLINSGIENASALEVKINEGAQNPINNVDIDKDQQRDYVQVREAQTNSPVDREFDFVAKPSGGGPEQQIAVIRFTEENGQPVMNANYTNVVSGYRDYYYTNPLERSLSFLLWAHAINRAAYYGTVPSSYVYVRSVPRQQFVQTQRTYQTTTRINPAPVSKPPATFSQSSFVNRSAPATNSNSLRSAASGVSGDFRTNSNNVRPKGAAFDNTPRASTPSPAPRQQSTPTMKSSSGASTPSRASTPSKASAPVSRSKGR
ncbi:MAG: hypothetical protein WC708_01070 [Lentisphaeria bacterium]